MSEEKKETDQAEDPELTELLDSALRDFDKPAVVPNKDENSTNTTSKEETKEETTVEEVWSQDFIKQAADQFQRNLEELMKNEGGNEIGESFKKMAESVAGAITSDSSDAEAVTADFQSAISQALKDLSSQSETLTNIPNISEADLAAMFGQTSLDDAGGDIFPFMQGMMQSLLSKDVLYPSMKDLVDRYPAWLDQNRTTISADELARFEKQLMLMQKVCTELEGEVESDSDETKKKRFETILTLMQEMQTCGQPPQDLISEQPSLFPLDADGNSIPAEALAGMDDSQNCSVM